MMRFGLPAGILLAWAACAVLGPLWVGDPNHIELQRILASPGPQGWLGFDDLGRPIWQRLVVGARTSFLVAGMVVSLTAVAGALIGTISPMVGLLGTVQGMIASFNVIATATTAPKPAELAQGISTALFTTLVGLFVAIPAIAAYSIIRNRIARLVLEVGIVSEGLMNRFQNVGGRRPEE